MLKKIPEKVLKGIIMGGFAVVIAIVLTLYIIHFDELFGFFNLVLLGCIFIYAFLSEKLFRKRFLTQYVVYPLIVITIYLLLILAYFSSSAIDMADSKIALIIIYAIMGMLFSLPISIVFDIVNELREKKKAKLLNKIKRRVFDDIPTGLILKDEKTEDFIIFVLAFLIVYLFFYFIHVF